MVWSHSNVSTMLAAGCSFTDLPSAGAKKFFTSVTLRLISLSSFLHCRNKRLISINRLPDRIIVYFISKLLAVINRGCLVSGVGSKVGVQGSFTGGHGPQVMFI